MADGVYFHGMPTRVEVAELEAAFPSLEAGQDILYDEVEKVIRITRDKSRFRVVTEAWRRKVRREKMLVIECVAGLGYHVQTPTEQINSGAKDYRNSARAMGRAHRKVAEVDPNQLSPVKRVEQEHYLGVMSRALDAVNKSRRALIQPPGPQQSIHHAMPPEDKARA